MRKRELVHLHALLDRTQRFLERREDTPEVTAEEYESIDVAPEAVYMPKQRHEDAVVALAGSLADAVGGEADATAEGQERREERSPGLATD